MRGLFLAAIALLSSGDASASCARRCGDEIALICASDGITYANYCLFRVAQCANASLVVVSSGVCAHPNEPTKLELEFASEKQCERACTREYMPVCGSDGVTYGNKCLFRNAKRCEYHGKLSIVKEGEC